MAVEYVAFMMSSDFEKGGFKTKEEAWEYIYSRDCEDCKEYRKKGHPLGGACSAEWDVETKEQLDKWKSESEGSK